MKRALLIAFHYPPARGSSGIQRALSFSRYLPEYGWQPIVLSADQRAYPDHGDDQLHAVPENIVVQRAFALDSARHLAYRGRYLSFLAYPDRWITWWPAAVARARVIFRQFKPDVIWSTYPIATAHLIALTVHRAYSVPWVADFRDSMTEDHYPTDKYKRKIFRSIEQKTVSNASYSTFTAPGTVDMYKNRYPHIEETRLKCLLNGYDEVAFGHAESMMKSTNREGNKLILVHSGLLYLTERDPTAFFAALRQLQQDPAVEFDNVEIRLRASGFEEQLQAYIENAGLNKNVRLLPPIGYSEALAEMLEADGLLLFQASNCNHQIPAKLYEYFRAKKPIFAMTDPVGDTANLLRQFGCQAIISSIESKDDIVSGLKSFLQMIAIKQPLNANEDVIQQFSRRNQTRQLAQLFDAVR